MDEKYYSNIKYRQTRYTSVDTHYTSYPQRQSVQGRLMNKEQARLPTTNGTAWTCHNVPHCLTRGKVMSHGFCGKQLKLSDEKEEGSTQSVVSFTCGMGFSK